MVQIIKKTNWSNDKKKYVKFESCAYSMLVLDIQRKSLKGFGLNNQMNGIIIRIILKNFYEISLVNIYFNRFDKIFIAMIWKTTLNLSKLQANH